MVYSVVLDCDNDAFKPGEEEQRLEIARILKRLAVQLETGQAPMTGDRQRLFDANGNNVGKAWADYTYDD